MKNRPLRVINSMAPIRICDNGGWTDTWFAGHGQIFNIAVSPFAEVQIKVFELDDANERITIHAETYGDQYTPGLIAGKWGRHPLLEASILSVGIPEELAIEVNVFSRAPAGASTGTSAAVTVALLGALDRLTPGQMTPHEIAYLAQSVETDLLGQQCGIQDQLCAAYGGINHIEMFQYPHASITQLQIPEPIWWELERRLLLVYLGRSHDSSLVHESVIRELEDLGPSAKQLEALRHTAVPSRDALYAADFQTLGQAMIQNNEAQRNLHPDLISQDAEQIIAIARAHGALGWKVNGAGGNGGSVTVLCNAISNSKRKMAHEIEAANPLYQIIPIQLSRHGLRVWEQSSEPPN